MKPVAESWKYIAHRIRGDQEWGMRCVIIGDRIDSANVGLPLSFKTMFADFYSCKVPDSGGMRDARIFVPNSERKAVKPGYAMLFSRKGGVSELFRPSLKLCYSDDSGRNWAEPVDVIKLDIE